MAFPLIPILVGGGRIVIFPVIRGVAAGVRAIPALIRKPVLLGTAYAISTIDEIPATAESLLGNAFHGAIVGTVLPEVPFIADKIRDKVLDGITFSGSLGAGEEEAIRNQIVLHLAATAATVAPTRFLSPVRAPEGVAMQLRRKDP